MKKFNVYTDGACHGNPGAGGWGAIIQPTDNEAPTEISGGESLTTNNRMELTAAISALEAIQEPAEITLTSDSKYLTDAINKHWLENWKRNGWRNSSGLIKNIDLWKRIDAQLQKHRVTFVWVKGHAGHPENERCDCLATQAISLLSR